MAADVSGQRAAGSDTGNRRALVTYTAPDDTTATISVYDGSSITVAIQPGSTYTYSATSSASDGAHRWCCNELLSGTAPASGHQTVSRIYFEQYKPTITLAGTSPDWLVGTEAHLLFGVNDPESGMWASWSDWCDAGSALTFGPLSSGVLRKKTTDTRSWIVGSVFAATIGYWPQGDVNHDNKVNVLDLQRLATSWNKQPGQAGYDPACDFTEDNRVNVMDLQIMASNWNRW